MNRLRCKNVRGLLLGIPVIPGVKKYEEPLLVEEHLTLENFLPSKLRVNIHQKAKKEDHGRQNKFSLDCMWCKDLKILGQDAAYTTAHWIGSETIKPAYCKRPTPIK